MAVGLAHINRHARDVENERWGRMDWILIQGHKVDHLCRKKQDCYFFLFVCGIVRLWSVKICFVLCLTATRKWESSVLGRISNRYKSWAAWFSRSLAMSHVPTVNQGILTQWPIQYFRKATRWPRDTPFRSTRSLRRESETSPRRFRGLARGLFHPFLPIITSLNHVIPIYVIWLIWQEVATSVPQPTE